MVEAEKFVNDAEANSKEQEFRSRAELLGREEQYGRRDPELQLLMFPESPKDINTAVVRVLENYTDFDKTEANSPYKVQYYMDAADAGVFIFGHSNRELQEEGYIEGEIGQDGYLSEEGKPKKFGYTIRVDTERQEITIKEQKEKRHEAWTEDRKETHYIPKFDASGKVVELKPVVVDVRTEHPARVEKWEEVSNPTINVEKFYYGKENERLALCNASKAAFERLVNTVRVHSLFEVMESYRADLSGLVTTLYLKSRHISNEQFRQIFNSPDISKISPESLTNNEYGTRIDRAMRMMDLLGHAETRGKMESFMNKPTFQKIIDAVKNNALEIMKSTGWEDEIQNASDDEKVVRFLIGKAAVKENGRWVLKGGTGWLTDANRDPSNATEEEKAAWKENPKSFKRGFGVLKNEAGVRGFLTEGGNVFARQKKIDLMLARITLLLGDKNAVRDADRYFQLTGMRDELNLEVLAKTMPTAEEIITAHRQKGEEGYNEWRTQADFWLQYFKLPGDPTGSDLSKIFYSEFYRLKDILKDRPAGPHITLFDYKRLTQSMFSLGRSEVNIGGETQTRSLLEQWRGYEVDGDMLHEDAKDFGEMDWDAVQVPETIAEAVSELAPEIVKEMKKAETQGEELSDDAKKAISDLMDESKGAIDGSLWSYYTLMNWLAGRDSPIKAPWLFILDETENLPVLKLTSTYTNKEKFLSIVWHDGALAWGNWRDLYREFKTTDAVNAELGKRAYNEVQRGKRSWYKGVQGLANFPELMAQRTRVIRVRGGGQGMEDVSTIDLVEGDPKEPGLAMKYGFLMPGEFKKNLMDRAKEQDRSRV